jgi:hypothetical protein
LRTTRAVVALVAATVLAAGCGSTIPTDEEATLLARDDLNPALVESTTTTARRSGATVPRKIYLIRDSETLPPRIFYCPLEVEVQDSPAETARATLEQLIRTEPGRTAESPLPGAAEPGAVCSSSLTNFVPTELRINDVEVDGSGLLSLDVSGLAAVEASAQRQAVAQIVFTLTDLIGIDRVVFYNEGRPAAVPVGDRTTEAGDPISRSDFPDYDEAPPRPTTTTTPPPAVEAEPPIGDPPPA